MIEEIHGLVTLKESNYSTGITPSQYDLLWPIIDNDDTDHLVTSNFPCAMLAYDTWRYEKTFKEEMEELYHKKPTTMGERIVFTMAGSNYELIMNLFAVANVMLMYSRVFDNG